MLITIIVVLLVICIIVGHDLTVVKAKLAETKADLEYHQKYHQEYQQKWTESVSLCHTRGLELQMYRSGLSRETVKAAMGGKES